MGKYFNNRLLVAKGRIDPASVSSDVTIGTSDVIGGSTGSVLFVGASTKLQQDNANFFWDDTNNRLGLGMAASPFGARLALKSSGATSSDNVQRWVSSASSTDLFSITGDAGFNIMPAGYIKSTSGGSTITDTYNSGTADKFTQVSDGTAFSIIHLTALVGPSFTVDMNTAAGSTGSSYITTDGYTQAFNEVSTGNNLSNTASANTLTFFQLANDSGGDGFEVQGVGGATPSWLASVYAGADGTQFSLVPTLAALNNPLKIQIGSNTSPSAATDAFVMYAADISAGNNAFHTIAEGGQIYYMGSMFGTKSAHDLIFSAGDADVARFTRTGGNLLIGGNVAATSATKTLHISNGTAPSAALTDGALLYSNDFAAGDARLYIRSESGVAMNIGNQQIVGGSSSGGNLTISSTSHITKGSIISDSIISGPVGAVGAPTYAFTGDLTTGIYHPAASQVGIALGGTLYYTFAATSLTFANSVNLAFNTLTGSQIATATSQKIGFWGKTPIIQPASANQAALSLDVDVTGLDTVDKAAINTNFTNIQTLVNQLRTDLVNAGLIKGAA